MTEQAAALRHQVTIGAGALVLASLLAWGAHSISRRPRAMPASAPTSCRGRWLPCWRCAGWLIYEAVSGGWRQMEEPNGAASGDWLALAWVAAGIVANAALLTRIGFILSCTVCFMLAVRACAAAKASRTAACVRGARLRDRLPDRGAGLLALHQGAGHQSAGPHHHRLDLMTAPKACHGVAALAPRGGARPPWVGRQRPRGCMNGHLDPTARGFATQPRRST